MIDFSSTVAINRSLEEVFRVLTDFENYLALWAAGPIAAAKTSSGPTGVGTTFTVTAKVGPIRVRSPYEVLVWEPPLSFGGRGVAGPVRFEEEYRLEGSGESTTLTQSIRAVPRGIFVIGEGAIRRQLQRLIPADLARLKLVLEEEERL